MSKYIKVRKLQFKYVDDTDEYLIDYEKSPYMYVNIERIDTMYKDTTDTFDEEYYMIDMNGYTYSILPSDYQRILENMDVIGSGEMEG